jgi:hypothetical protein
LILDVSELCIGLFEDLGDDDHYEPIPGLLFDFGCLYELVDKLGFAVSELVPLADFGHQVLALLRLVLLLLPLDYLQVFRVVLRQQRLFKLQNLLLLDSKSRGHLYVLLDVVELVIRLNLLIFFA